MQAIKQLEIMLSAIQALKDLPVKKLADNQTLMKEIKSVLNAKNLGGLLAQIQKDYNSERMERARAKPEGPGPESTEFLHTFARFKTRAHEIFTGSLKEENTKYTQPVTLTEASAFNSINTAKNYAKAIGRIKQTSEAKEFKEVFNSIFSDHALQIGTAQDPTRIGSYIDYSPYIYNYQYYLSIPTLSQTIDKPIQIATRQPPNIDGNNEELEEMVKGVLKRSRFVEKLRRMLLFSHLSPRGSLIVPIKEANRIRFNIFNDTQFTYATGYQYTRMDFRDDGSDGVTQIYVLGNILRNGVTAHFLCPGFEPIYAIGKNRIYPLKDAAEAVNIYLYTVKVLCIRAQILTMKWGGDSQNDTAIERLRATVADIDSKLSLNTLQKLPEGADLDIVNNNLSEGFAKVSPIIKEYQGMLSGVNADYFYGSDTAYNANSFNIHSTHQTIRSEIQEGQIEPIYRFIINKYIREDERFAKFKNLEDDFDLKFLSLYEPTDQEAADIAAKKIDNITKMAAYPELQKIFRDEDLLGKDYVLPAAPEPPTEPPENE